MAPNWQVIDKNSFEFYLPQEARTSQLYMYYLIYIWLFNKKILFLTTTTLIH